MDKSLCVWKNGAGVRMRTTGVPVADSGGGCIPSCFKELRRTSHAEVPSGKLRVAMAQKEDDLSTIDGLIRAMYDVISGPAGPRDWDRERALFYRGGRLMPAGRGPAGGAGGEIMDVEGYIASRSPFFSA